MIPFGSISETLILVFGMLCLNCACKTARLTGFDWFGGDALHKFWTVRDLQSTHVMNWQWCTPFNHNSHDVRHNVNCIYRSFAAESFLQRATALLYLCIISRQPSASHFNRGNCKLVYFLFGSSFTYLFLKPLQISVSLPQEYASFTSPVLMATPSSPASEAASASVGDFEDSSEVTITSRIPSAFLCSSSIFRILVFLPQECTSLTSPVLTATPSSPAASVSVEDLRDLSEVTIAAYICPAVFLIQFPRPAKLQNSTSHSYLCLGTSISHKGNTG